jgi:indolepyruvate ferredoxin oxidoreductase, alpha subunit
VLCPSFYRADVVHNPSAFEQRWQGLRDDLIGWFQGRRSARRVEFHETEQ